MGFFWHSKFFFSLLRLEVEFNLVGILASVTLLKTMSWISKFCHPVVGFPAGLLMSNFILMIFCLFIHVQHYKVYRYLNISNLDRQIFYLTMRMCNETISQEQR